MTTAMMMKFNKKRKINSEDMTITYQVTVGFQVMVDYSEN